LEELDRITLVVSRGGGQILGVPIEFDRITLQFERAIELWKTARYQQGLNPKMDEEILNLINHINEKLIKLNDFKQLPEKARITFNQLAKQVKKTHVDINGHHYIKIKKTVTFQDDPDLIQNVDDVILVNDLKTVVKNGKGYINLPKDTSNLFNSKNLKLKQIFSKTTLSNIFSSESFKTTQTKIGNNVRKIFKGAE
jgi:RNA-binding protein YhbY